MKHLLLIDDDTRFLLLMGNFLEERGYQISRAANGKQGIEVLARLTRESRPPDLIVCDVMMPHMDGYEFVHALRAMPGHEVLPVIFLSAKAEVNDRIRGLKEGGDAYLVKPFDPDELVALTEALLRRSEHAQTSGRDQSGQAGWRNLGKPALAIQCDVALTTTEGKVLRYVARGLSNKEISKELGISQRTVESHVSNMLQKTTLTNRSELTRWGIESGHI
ncbi:MAG: response regulator transcription factor [Gloeobacterales cyanobacterium]